MTWCLTELASMVRVGFAEEITSNTSLI